MEATIKSKMVFGQNWEIKPLRHFEGKDTYSADDLIDAYFKGRKDQENRGQQLMLDKLESNLKKAQKFSEELFGFISSQGFNCSHVLLRVKDIYRYTSIFIVNEDDYCNDKFMEVYKYSIEIKKKANKTSTFDFTTIFTPQNKFLDNKTLIADGYIMSYEGVHKS